MGFNTIAFMLNDLSHELENSPKTVAFLLTNPHIDEETKRGLSDYFEEPPIHHQALRILPYFHSSSTKYYIAGGNTCGELEERGRCKRKGRDCVILELPEYLQK